MLLQCAQFSATLSPVTVTVTLFRLGGGGGGGSGGGGGGAAAGLPLGCDVGVPHASAG